MENSERKGFLKIAGDYRSWSVYKKSVIICDVTEMFITRYLPKNSRTIDQMRQAARSCKQNIVEGITDGTISAEMCIKLIGVARGSIRELNEDYGDYLRQNKLEIWSKNDSRTEQVRSFCRTHADSRDFVDRCETRTPETIANIMMTLTYQMDAMLAKVMKGIEDEFLKNGGIKEAMSRARRDARGW